MQERELNVLKAGLKSEARLGDIFTYLAEHKAEYTELSARGLVNGMTNKGDPIGLGPVRRFLSLLVKAGLGKEKWDENGNITNVVDMTKTTREIGIAMVGDSKNLKKFNADRKARNIEGTAKAVSASPSDFKVYPMRKASNVSISLTINGKPVILPLPDDLSPDELATLISRLKRVEDGWRK